MVVLKILSEITGLCPILLQNIASYFAIRVLQYTSLLTCNIIAISQRMAMRIAILCRNQIQIAILKLCAVHAGSCLLPQIVLPKIATKVTIIFTLLTVQNGACVRKFVSISLCVEMYSNSIDWDDGIEVRYPITTIGF